VTDVFLDTNVLLYSLSTEEQKRSRATSLITAGPTISVQVLNEFVNVVRKKLKWDVEKIPTFLRPIRNDCLVVSLTVETHDLAMQIACTHKFKIYDANIIAAAELSGCEVLYSEDMQHGQRVGRVLIQNPFVAA
jgi:predicted nucleic acid-binding protein